MEFNFAINEIATEEIVKIDPEMTVNGCYKNENLKEKMALIVDAIGHASAVSQELKSPITSAKQLANSNHTLYMMTEHPSEGLFAVVGFLKVGWKHLYLYDKVGGRSEAMVCCLMDFYVHETRQRNGYGIRLLQHVLKDTNLQAKNLAIDKPTGKLLQFMWKHFQLSKLVNQGNNFVIFEEFFQHSTNDNNSTNGERGKEHKSQPTFGRHEAHKHHDSMGEIVAGDDKHNKYKYCHNADIVDNQFSEVNPHPGNLGAFGINEDGNSVKRDLESNHSTFGSDNSSMSDFYNNRSVNEKVVKIDHNLQAIGNHQNEELQNSIGLIIDGMGNASAVAQELKAPVTSAEKLMHSNHIVYVMTEHPAEEYFGVVGFLKMGWKKLYLYDKVGARSEASVYCLLDFYIRETKQRKGHGKRLIDFMLKDVNLTAKNLAIDKPTEKLMQFMWKHFKLSKLVNQGNNFVIYEEFFENSSAKNVTSNDRASGYKKQAMFGRHGAHKHHDTMGESGSSVQ
ncbi:alpha-tubulin N-acetyltransferase 1-like isoform X2 [Adelges cooleyi]|uniref:alpha-tubulin N-acetyltransferase 1-like isoform X2 n=1 Tax=Adelges cooleyi TaxID=133065 RepID=UPI00217F9986|nr:alpha-tubulin N-acetyltransferase 1-like isoform X2 [Adelges cooleyi]